MRLAAILQEMKRFDEANKIYDEIVSDHEQDASQDGSKISSFLQFQAHQVRLRIHYSPNFQYRNDV